MSAPSGLRRSLRKKDKLQFIGEMQIVGRCLGAAVANILDLSLRDVEGAVPYGFERSQIRCRRRILNDFVVVGDGALDVP